MRRPYRRPWWWRFRRHRERLSGWLRQGWRRQLRAAWNRLIGRGPKPMPEDDDDEDAAMPPIRPDDRV